MMTQNPIWGGTEALLEFFTTEEEQAVWDKAADKVAQRHVPRLKLHLPRKHPKWNPDKSDELESLKEYQDLIPCGIQNGVEKKPKVI